MVPLLPNGGCPGIPGIVPLLPKGGWPGIPGIVLFWPGIPGIWPWLGPWFCPCPGCPQFPWLFPPWEEESALNLYVESTLGEV